MTPAAWLHALDERRAQSVVAVPGGLALLHDSFPDAHDHNKLSIVQDTDAAALAAAADDVLGGAGRGHRLVQLRTPHDRAARALTDWGYARSNDLVMTYVEANPAPRPDVTVEVLTLRERIDVAEAGWRQELPAAGPDVWRQLGARIATVTSATQATFLGVRGEDGQVVARADLYAHEGSGQVEEVVTDGQHRRRGFAGALVLTAVRRALQQGSQEVFLLADADDSPRHLYARLGFREGDVLASYSREGAGSPRSRL